MGWTASYQLLRDRPLDDEELAALADYVERNNQPPWEGERFGLVVTREARADRIVADGWQKLPMTTETADLERLCVVLNGLAAVLPGVEIRIDDDHGAFGWDAAVGRVTTEDDPGPAPLELTREARATFAAPGSLIPPRFRPLPPKVAAWLTGQGEPSQAILRAALVELVTMAEGHPARADLLARLALAPAGRLAKAGLKAYADIARSHGAWDVAKAALERLADPAEVVDEFLAVWCKPRGIYWYGDMRFPEALLDGMARQPAVQQQLLDDVAAALAGAPSELAHRRAEHAAELLGRARSAPALVALIAGARATRGARLSMDMTLRTVTGLYEGLVRAAVPAVAPTLLLELGTALRAGRPHARAVTALVAIDPGRAGPLLAALVGAGALTWELVPVLQGIGDEPARAALARLCAHPEPRERERARAALRALGVEPPAEVAVPPPEALIAHPDTGVRERAMRAIDEAGDRSRMAGLAIAGAIDRALRQREGIVGGLAWRLLEPMPGKVRRASLDAQLAWFAGDDARDLPAQVLWPEAEAAVALGVDALVARVPRQWPRLDAATEAALIAEEAAILAGLRAGTLAPDAPLAVVVPRPAPIGLLPVEQPAPPPTRSTVDA